jgi:uroporphyrinogen-III decarboxylase
MNAPQVAMQTPDAKAAYDARWQRIMDCVALKQPDRMPVVMYGTFWFARYGGISFKELMYDYEKTKEIIERAVLEFEPDAVAPLVAATVLGPVLDAVDFKQLQWPGHGVGDNQPYQYLDREYMKPEEYTQLVQDPTGFYLNTYLPRIFGAFEGFERFPRLPGTYYFRTISALRPLADSEFRKSLRRVLDAADEVNRYVTHSAEWNERIMSLGFPLINGSNSGAPYDVIADYFRGATGMMKDLYRNKDKLHDAIEVMRRNLTRMTIDNARASGNPIVMIPIHWAPDAFMSQKHFEEFWWPSFRQMMVDLIEAGLIPMPLWEADCTKRLEAIRDVPPGKCIYWFERTDMTKAFEVLGDVVALRGNLSPSLMTTGHPEEVDVAVRQLVENVWNKGGSLILDTAFGIPDETPVENVRAMYTAARKYGA